MKSRFHDEENGDHPRNVVSMTSKEADFRRCPDDIEPPIEGDHAADSSKEKEFLPGIPPTKAAGSENKENQKGERK